MSDLFVQNFSNEDQLLTLGITRIPVEVTCVQRAIQPADERMALGALTCSIVNAKNGATGFMEMAIEVNCPTTALEWHYGVEARNINNDFGTDFKLYRTIFDMNTGALVREVIGSGISRASSFWGGASELLRSPLPNTCLISGQLSYWKNAAEAAIAAEASHAAPSIVRSMRLNSI